MNLFSVPYNGYDINVFLEELEKRKENINDIYCELPYVYSCKTMNLGVMNFIPGVPFIL